MVNAFGTFCERRQEEEVQEAARGFGGAASRLPMWFTWWDIEQTTSNTHSCGADAPGRFTAETCECTPKPKHVSQS